MKNKLFSILTVVLSAGIMTSCVSFSDEPNIEYIKMEAEPTYAWESEVLGDDVLPIVTFCSPLEERGSYANTMTDEVMQLLKDSGINIVMTYSISNGSAQEKKLADLCEKHGIGIMASTGESGYWRIDKAQNTIIGYEEYSAEEQKAVDDAFRELLQGLTEYKNLVGIRFTDEDGIQSFASAGAARKVFDEVLGKDKFFSHNLISQQGSYSMLEYGYSFTKLSNAPISNELVAGGYNYYLSHELETVGPTALSYDLYPFNKMTKVNGVIHENMRTAYNMAYKYQKPFWNYIQVYGGDGSNPSELARIPNYNEMEWQVSASLGMGAKGLVLYPYFWPLEQSEDGFQTAFGRDGKPTQMYYDLKTPLANIASYDHIIMNSTTKSVMIGGIEKNILQKPSANMIVESFNELQSVASHETGVVVYNMNYQGKTALYVVNASIEENKVADISLHFSKKVEASVYQNGEKSVEVAKNLTLKDVPSGRAVMVVLGE